MSDRIPPSAPSSDELRRRAVERVGSDWPQPPEAPQPEELRRTLHELRVHQVELEIQNEELRRAQQEVEASRARYFDLYDLAPVGYLTLGAKGLIVEGNLTCAALLGVARSELPGGHLSRFVSPEDFDIYYLERHHLFETSGSRSVELRLLRGQTTFWARLEGNASRDADGVQTFRVVVSDISERKRFADVKARMDEQTQQVRKAESLSRMAGAIAHHFNNMLAGVLGNLELAAQKIASDTSTVELLAQATKAGKRAAEVSRLMLTYLGQPSGEREILDLSDACGESLLALQSALPRSLVLQVERPLRGPMVRANKHDLRQVLNNLITNAWEVPGARAPICVAVKTVEAEAVPSGHRFPIDWCPTEKLYACVEVADRGAGIASTDLPNLFDPFFSSKFVGRGLGLAVVAGIARAHGGVVTVESKSGDGSVFSVFFPVSETGNVERAGPRAGRSPALQNTTVLLVEDEEIVRKLTVTMLGQLGFSVLSAKDGEEAVEVFRRRPSEIHCVICDVTMPGINGWETLEALRRLASGIPVVLASGYSEASVMADIHTEQPNGFLSKPYGMDELEAAISRALSRPEP